jgi:hypothetical protein
MAGLLFGGILGAGALNDAIHGENPLDRFTKFENTGMKVFDRAPRLLDTGLNTADQINKILPIIGIGFVAVVLIVLLKK